MLWLLVIAWVIGFFLQIHTQHTLIRIILTHVFFSELKHATLTYQIIVQQILFFFRKKTPTQPY